MSRFPEVVVELVKCGSKAAKKRTLSDLNGIPYAVNCRTDGTIQVSVAGESIVQNWPKLGDGSVFVNWGSARYTYRRRGSFAVQFSDVDRHSDRIAPNGWIRE